MNQEFFNQSQNTGKVSEALANVQADLPIFTVDKDGYNFKYLTLSKILEVVLPIAGKHGLSISQFPSVFVVEDAPWVRIMTRLSCGSEYFDSNFEFPMILPTKKTDTDITSMGSTVSYLRRFALQSILGIAGADKDPEEVQRDEITDRANPNEMKLK